MDFILIKGKRAFLEFKNKQLVLNIRKIKGSKVWKFFFNGKKIIYNKITKSFSTQNYFKNF